MKKLVISILGGIVFSFAMCHFVHAISRQAQEDTLSVTDWGYNQIFETITLTSFTAANGNLANNLVSAYSESRAYLQCVNGPTFRVSLSSFSVGLVAGAANTILLDVSTQPVTSVFTTYSVGEVDGIAPAGHNATLNCYEAR